MAKVFGNLFVYDDEAEYKHGAHAFSSCHLLKPLQQNNHVVIAVDQEIDEVLVDILNGRIKFHVGNQIVTSTFGACLGDMITVKSDKDNDSDFEYDESDDDL